MPEPRPAERPARARVAAFVALTLACVAAAAGYVAWAASRDDARGGPARATKDVSLTNGAGRDAPRVVFQHVARDQHYAQVAIAPTARGAGARMFAPLVCERVHVSSRRGLCLSGEQAVTGTRYRAQIFDARFAVRHELEIDGLLSRARVSPDGRYGATTGFVTGHSYADPGAFSTHTTIIDMARGRILGDLEDFTTTRDGRTIRSADRNFWGVTFARDSDRFYATLRTGGRTWLIEGSVRARRARTLHENVECPSLSPDGTRIAYKKRVDQGSVIWRLYVLDLRTMEETALADSRLVDDQAEWLDDETVLYGRVDGQIWAQPADGSGSPRVFLQDALSPAVIGQASRRP